MGILPSQSSNHISMFMKTSFGMKVSRFVIRRQPSSVSCTMPITGLLPCTFALHHQYALYMRENTSLCPVAITASMSQGALPLCQKQKGLCRIASPFSCNTRG